jgi:hypothetical protein
MTDAANDPLSRSGIQDAGWESKKASSRLPLGNDE